MTSYDPTSIDKQILGFCLNFEFFSKVSNTVTRDMFTKEMRDVFDVITYTHTTYECDITVGELAAPIQTHPCLLYTSDAADE